MYASLQKATSRRLKRRCWTNLTPSERTSELKCMENGARDIYTLETKTKHVIFFVQENKFWRRGSNR